MAGVTQDGILQVDEVGGGGSSTSVAIGQPINATDAAVLNTDPVGSEYALATRLVTPLLGVGVNIVNQENNLVVDIASSVPLQVTSASFATRLDEASAVITYVGNAAPGSLTSDAVWQIKRLDSTSGLVVEYADGTADFDNIWDDRAILSYS